MSERIDLRRIFRFAQAIEPVLNSGRCRPVHILLKQTPQRLGGSYAEYFDPMPLFHERYPFRRFLKLRSRTGLKANLTGTGLFRR